MAMQQSLQLTDIPWLRLAGRAAGTADMPATIASKLLSGGFVQRDERRGCLVITPRGKLALTRLG